MSDSLQMNVAKKLVLEGGGRGAYLATASNNAKASITLNIFNSGVVDFPISSDPYLARIGSIPFRSSVIRRNQLENENHYITQLANGVNSQTKTDLYGTLLIQMNSSNLLMLDRVNYLFLHPLKQ